MNYMCYMICPCIYSKRCPWKHAMKMHSQNLNKQHAQVVLMLTTLQWNELIASTYALSLVYVQYAGISINNPFVDSVLSKQAQMLNSAHLHINLTMCCSWSIPSLCTNLCMCLCMCAYVFMSIDKGMIACVCVCACLLDVYTCSWNWRDHETR